MLKTVQNIDEDSVVSILRYAVGPQEVSLQRAVNFYRENKNAVGFYKRYGFSIKSLGEKYPDVERFHCCLIKTATE
ncbi:hypothetical protein QUF99_17085 [Bacillus sp. DX4.1]|uniref:hypothetical protein n=1 Tax=Bacillus sp. DX4.1 TaxID=3055867 RepID=UPI0025A2C934|nr:hypothetical protein [Bacillus sp. DX4.1]MDM5188969.1 hypothetical protein [Bacillus sp. DX4.1]